MSGSYTDTPFGLHILNPIVAVGNHIDLASGIIFGVQTPSSVDADLATLTFQVTTGCGMGAVQFRANKPPTAVTDALGQPIVPISLVDLNTQNPCPGDLLASGAVDVNDLLQVITHWGACPASPTCCLGNANGDVVVDVNDLLTVITHWGACP